jgi:hypothetical protein
MTTKTKTLRERVYDAIPHYADSRTILENLPTVELPTPQDLDTERRELIGKVREHVLAGTPIPADLGEAFLTATRERERYTVLAETVRDVGQIARDNIQAARDYQWGESIEILNAELDDIVTTARTVADTFDGITTAADALASRNPNVADAWRELQCLADRYDEVRSLQAELTPSEIPQRAEKLYSTGLFRDAISVSSYFVRRGQATVTHTPNGTERRFNGHRVDGDDSWWPNDIDRAGALLRIIQADPWVPTAEVMEEAFNLASAATSNNLSSYDDERASELIANRTAAYHDYVEGQP